MRSLFIYNVCVCIRFIDIFYLIGVFRFIDIFYLIGVFRCVDVNKLCICRYILSHQTLYHWISLSHFDVLHLL